MPSTLRNIGDNAFDACNSIKTITSRIVKDSLKAISDNVFTVRQNQNTTLFVPIESGVVSKYRNTAGWNFANIIEGEKGQELKTIENIGKIKYEYLTGPKTATIIEANLDDIYTLPILGTVKIDTVDYKVTAIGDNVFKGKTNIKTIVVSDSIERIGAYTFQGCSGLERVELPSTLDRIGEKAFDGCNSLKYVLKRKHSHYLLDHAVGPGLDDFHGPFVFIANVAV